MSTRATAALPLEFDADAAEEKALVRLRQASSAGSGSLLVLRSGGVVLESLAFGIVAVALMWAGVTLFGGGSGEILDTPRGVVVGGVVVAALVVGLFVGIAGQLLVAQAAVARSTRLSTTILAELNHTLTASIAAGGAGLPVAVAAAAPAQPQPQPEPVVAA
jgi:hypothetical protein